MNVLKFFEQVCVWLDRVAPLQSGARGTSVSTPRHANPDNCGRGTRNPVIASDNCGRGTRNPVVSPDNCGKRLYDARCIIARMVLALLNVPFSGFKDLEAETIYHKMCAEADNYLLLEQHRPTHDEVMELDCDISVGMDNPWFPEDYRLVDDGTRVLLPLGITYLGKQCLPVPRSILSQPYDREKRIFTTLSCYCTLPECSQSWSIESTFIDTLVEKGVTVELFASAINRNMQIPQYCAVADPYAVGDYFDPKFTFQPDTRYYANPPFIESVLTAMVIKMTEALARLPNLTFYVVLPYWNDSEVLHLCLTSPYLKSRESLDYKYGVYDAASETVIRRNFALYVVVLSNDPTVETGENSGEVGERPRVITPKVFKPSEDGLGGWVIDVEKTYSPGYRSFGRTAKPWVSRSGFRPFSPRYSSQEEK